MKTQSFGIDLHSLIRISAPSMPSEIAAVLMRRFGTFCTDEPKSGDQSDIVLECLGTIPPYSPEQNRFNILYGFGIAEYEGKTGIFFTYKGRPDIIITVSESIRIYYAHRPKVVHRLYGLLLYSIEMVLGGRGGMLFHGAAVQREGRSVIITGHRGTKKTMLLLSLLREGWNFLSDDKMILYDGTVKLFHPLIRIRGHHVTSLPWVAGIIRERRSFLRRSSIGNVCTPFAQKMIHKQLLPAVEKYLNPALEVHVREIFAGHEAVSSAVPTHVVMMLLGQRLHAEVAACDDCLDDIATIQELLFYNYWNLEQFLRLYHIGGRRNVREAVRQNIADCTIVRVTAPLSCPVETLRDVLLGCIR